jgi:hypothetical protein
VALPPARLSFVSIPWPRVAPLTAPELFPPTPASTLSLSTEEVKAVLLPPGASGAVARRALQDALRLWHPDKFHARFGGALLEAERAAILEGVNRVAQCIAELMSRV